jgi:hypothetical protein
LRRWQLDENKPLSLQIAADARLSQTDYIDDQSWDLRLKSDDDTSLVLQSQYGGRIGSVRIALLLTIDGRRINQPHMFHTPPVVTAFAPGFIRVEAMLTPTLSTVAEYWVADSHSVLGRVTLQNRGDVAVKARLDMDAEVRMRTQPLQIAVLTLTTDENALYFGKFGNIDPVLLVAGGTMGTDRAGHVASRVGKSWEIGPENSVSLRWVHVALPGMQNSIQRARYWLEQDYETLRRSVRDMARSVPSISTQNSIQDATLAFAQMQLLQGFLRPTHHLPHSPFVTLRFPKHGYSARGDGSDHIRGWQQQSPTVAYVLAQAVASSNPTYAEGIIKNYLAVQHEDGWIDASPGIAGQKRDLLMMPILARLAWRVYEQTQNQDFLATSLDGLIRFFERWFYADVDADGDGLPEWQDVTQTGYSGWPLFAPDGVDIRMIECPDMLAYLLSEADHLTKIAKVVDRSEVAGRLASRIQELEAILGDLWQEDRFVYRDRDTHLTPTTVNVLEKVRADEQHLPTQGLPTPTRLLVDVFGGASSKPHFSVVLAGLDAEGQEIEETLSQNDFVWTYGRGSGTSKTVFSQIDRIKTTGLSRVFRFSVYTSGLESDDINTFLPLIAQRLSDDKAVILVGRLQKMLLKPNGLALYPQSETTGGNESGIWVYWNTLLCEALLDKGYDDLAADIFKRLLRVQGATLRDKGWFTLFYDEDDMRGRSDTFDLQGVVPLHLLLRFMGIHLRGNGTLEITDAFPWGEAVELSQHGVHIVRNKTETIVTFPDSTTKTVPMGASETLTIPASAIKAPMSPKLPQKPDVIAETPPSTPIRIQVEID